MFLSSSNITTEKWPSLRPSNVGHGYSLAVMLLMSSEMAGAKSQCDTKFLELFQFFVVLKMLFF